MRGLVCCAGVVICGVVAAFVPAGEGDTPKPSASPTDATSPRKPWTTSRVKGSPEPPPPFAIERIYPGWRFANPVCLINGPERKRMYLAELGGRILSFPDKDNPGIAHLVLDGKKSIPGLTRVYGMAFHPKFNENQYVYLCYITKMGSPTGTKVSRFRMKPSTPPSIDPSTEEVLVEWLSGGHNGGCLKFGPDGYLYISTGDASPPNPPDVHATGQGLNDLLSVILRIDVDNASESRPYSIPEDNPFVGQKGAQPEIWAYGFRNPWKMNFDAAGNLWVGDVGWELWEMIYRVERGGNYGWSIVEGPQPVRTEYPRGPTPILPPIAAHNHVEARSMTGGFVYRGKSLPALQGQYIYGDYVTGKIWSLPADTDAKSPAKPRELVDTPLQIITFAETGNHELLVVDYQGAVYRLKDNSDAKANEDFPKQLSETGMFSSVKGYQPAAGVLSYEINATPWEDGATAERLLAVPGAPTLSMYKNSNAQIGYLKGQWQYPSGTVFAKTVSLEMEVGNPATRKRIETQVLHFEEDSWRAYSYAWNEEETEASLVPADGQSKTYRIQDGEAPGGFREQTWRFHSRTECLVCHVARGGTVLGFQIPQLTSRNGERGELDRLMDLGLFGDPIAELKTLKMKAEAPYVDVSDETGTITERARTYLHVNCAHCHRRGGGGTAPFELLAALPLEKTEAVGVRPTQGTFGIFGAEVIAPGDPERSVLYYRMATLGKGHMPHLGATQIDETGLDVIHSWIKQLPATTPASPAEKTRQQLRAKEELALTGLKTGQNAEAALDQLFGTTSGSLRLMDAMSHEKFPAETRDKILAHAMKAPAASRGLFERFLSPENRTKTLGTSIEPEQILSLRGDASRGRDLFLKSETVQCRNCHQVGDAGKELGPKLDEIGKKLSSPQILQSILKPSEKIDPKYVSYLVETSQGEVLSGLMVERTAEQVKLKNAAGKVLTVSANNVVQLVPQRKSIMPELLLQDLTAEQVADLLAYLGSLKGE